MNEKISEQSIVDLAEGLSVAIVSACQQCKYLEARNTPRHWPA